MRRSHPAPILAASLSGFAPSRGQPERETWRSRKFLDSAKHSSLSAWEITGYSQERAGIGTTISERRRESQTTTSARRATAPLYIASQPTYPNYQLCRRSSVADHYRARSQSGTSRTTVADAGPTDVSSTRQASLDPADPRRSWQCFPPRGLPCACLRLSYSPRDATG